MEIHPIARIHSDFPGKFGIPRQDRKSVRVGKECRSRWSPYH